jgi:osmotically-inducible protein OsmY
METLEEGHVKSLIRLLPVVALVAAGPVFTGCEQKANTPNYESRVQDRLKDAKLDDVNANWKNDEKALHLSGKVKAEAEKQRAEVLASEVVGTSGRVVNEVKVEDVDTNQVDNDIEQRLDKMFKEDDQSDRDNTDLTFHSKAGVVTVTGNAPSQAIKDRVTQRVRAVDGVKDVVNDLEIKPANASTTRNKRPSTNK